MELRLVEPFMSARVRLSEQECPHSRPGCREFVLFKQIQQAENRFASPIPKRLAMLSGRSPSSPPSQLEIKREDEGSFLDRPFALISRRLRTDGVVDTERLLHHFFLIVLAFHQRLASLSQSMT